jgi:hypothetical protein
MAGLCEEIALWQPARSGFPRRRPTKMAAEADSAVAAPAATAGSAAKTGSFSPLRSIVHYFEKVGK